VAGAVDEAAAVDRDEGLARRRGDGDQCERQNGEQGEAGRAPGDAERTGPARRGADAQAATGSGAGTFRENVIAPSSSVP
jgi:hypothetical protein